MVYNNYDTTFLLYWLKLKHFLANNKGDFRSNLRCQLYF